MIWMPLLYKLKLPVCGSDLGWLKHVFMDWLSYQLGWVRVTDSRMTRSQPSDHVLLFLLCVASFQQCRCFMMHEFLQCTTVRKAPASIKLNQYTRSHMIPTDQTIPILSPVIIKLWWDISETSLPQFDTLLFFGCFATANNVFKTVP